MKKFIVIYLVPKNATWKTKESSPEEKEESMKAWMAWAQKCGDHIVDFGSPLGDGMTIRPGGNTSASESEILGYSIMQADSMKLALRLLEDHPHLDWNTACEIELREALPAPGN